MFNFFDLNIIPTFLSRFNVDKILAIGLSNKEIINLILDYCSENSTSLTTIDSRIDILEFKTDENKEFLENITYHKDCSLNILPTLMSFDAVFINGDPNWYTVYNELNLIKKTNTSFPLVFICNNKYPHKRRDSYLNPENIPEEFKNECCNDLPVNYEEDGEIKQTLIKDGFCHAILDDTPKNGVLTAIEDFLEENKSLKLMEINPLEGVTLIYKPSNIVDIRIKKILEEEIESEYTPGDLSDKFIENKLLLSYVTGMNLLKEDIEKVDEFKSELENANSQLKDYERDAQLHDTLMRYKDSRITNVESQISLKDTQLKNMEAKLVNKELELNNKNSQIETTINRLSNLEKYFLDTKKQLGDVDNKLKNKELELKDKDNQLKTSLNEINSLKSYEIDIKNNTTEIQYLKKSDKESKKLLIPLAYLYLIGKSNPKEIGTNIKLYRALKSSECFDIGYYLNEYPDVLNSKWCKYFSPELHYVCNGFDEYRNFNKKDYNKRSKKDLLYEVENK